MEILFKNEQIGLIENTYREDFWVHGNFIPEEGYRKYKGFFDAIVCEDGMDEKMFDPELLDENNWFVRDKEAVNGIWVPAIYSDGDVSIRYR